MNNSQLSLMWILGKKTLIMENIERYDEILE